MLKKHIFSAIFLLAVFAANAQTPAPVQLFDNENDFVIETVGSGQVARITGYNGTRTEIRIPPQIRRMTVIGIRERAFYGKGITSVAIPNNVILIESMAFSGNEITQITIGANADCREDSFDSGFVQFYNENGRSAGTYVFSNGLWGIQAPALSSGEAETPPRASGTASRDNDFSIDPYPGFSVSIALWDYGPGILSPRLGLHLGLMLEMGGFKFGFAGAGSGFLGAAFPSFEDSGISYGFDFGSFIELFFTDFFYIGLGGGIARGYFTTKNNLADDYFFPFAQLDMMLGDEDESLGLYFRYYFNDSDKWYNTFSIGIKRKGF